MAKINSIDNKTSALNINGEYDLPTSDESINQIMTTDGSGTISWTRPSGIYVQGTSAYTSSIITINNTGPSSLPYKTDGVEVLTASITPKNASNILYIPFLTYYGCSSALSTRGNVFLIQDDKDYGFAAMRHVYNTTSIAFLKVSAKLVAGTTSSTTIKARVGLVGNYTGYTNYNYYGSVGLTTLIIEENKAL